MMFRTWSEKCRVSEYTYTTLKKNILNDRSKSAVFNCTSQYRKSYVYIVLVEKLQNNGNRKSRQQHEKTVQIEIL